MGVRKLLSYLRDHEAAIATPLELPKEDGTRATVLVDAYALWITLAERATRFMEDAVPNECLFHDADLVGGDCYLACEGLHRFVTVMRDVCNVDLVFLRDAPRGVDGLTSYRDAVWNNRELERQKVTQQHYDYCRGDSLRKYSEAGGAAKKPLPYFIFRAMAGVLHQHQVPMVVLDGEVDLSIGSMFFEFGASFLLAGDTDFLVMPNIPTVLLQTLPWNILLQDTSIIVGSSAVNTFSVLTSERLGTHLALSGRQLRLLACLLGNDTTEEVATFSGQLEALVQIVRTHPDDDDNEEWYMDAGLLTQPSKKKKREGRKHNSSNRAKSKKDSMRAPALSDEPEGPIEEMTCIAEEESSPAALVRKSCAEYVAASQRQPYVPATFPGGVSDALRQLYRSGDISSNVLPLVVHGITFRKLPAWETDSPSPSSLPTIRRAEKTVWRLLGRRRVLVANPRDGTVQDCSATDDDSELVFTNDAFLRLREGRDANIKLAWLRHALLPFHGDDDGEQARGDVSFEECLLWIAHSGMFNEDELLVVAMMIECLQHDSGESQATFEWQKEVCQHHRMNEKPFPRCLDISSVVAAAYSIAGDLFDLLGLPALVIRPERAYSGTLLHCLFTCYQEEEEEGGKGSWFSKLPSELVDRARRMICSTESKFKSMAGEWLKGVAPPRGVRIRVDWVGLLQRDEVVDFLDGGGEGATTTATIRGKKGEEATTEQVEAAVAANPLPILEFLPNTLDTIEKCPVVCIQGDTGCGKSSMVPLHLYLQARERKQRVCIIVTQPRRLAAISLARRVASLLNEEVGHTVGYRIGGGNDYHVESPRTCIYFVTTGYLLEALVHGSNLWSRSTHILLDEVHERTIESDMLSLVIKLTRGPGESHHRLVLMSATLQIELFTNYFRTSQTENVPTLQVGCKRYHIEEHFMEDTIQALGSRVPKSVCDSLQDYMKRVQKCSGAPFALRPEHIHAVTNIILACVKHGSCILVFLPGLNEIEAVFEDLSACVKRMGNVCTVRICTLHSVVELEEQHRAVEPSTAEECKIVLSTNIAETSITIPDVKVVIDLGMARRVEYDAAKKIRALICGWCSKSAMRQRAGRAGRVSNGIVYRLYTRETVQLMNDFDASEFMPLEYSVLQVHAHLCEYGDVRDLMQKLPDPPPADLVAAALDNLVSWGAVSSPPELELTPLGKLALRMPIDVALTRAILMASALGCAAEMVVVAAGFTLQRSLFPRPLRSFYNSDREYIQNLAAVDKTIEHFDRSRRSDVHMFLSIFEEASHHGQHHKMMQFARTRGIASRQLTTFVNYVRNVAGRLLQEPAPFLHEKDRALLDTISSRAAGTRPPVSFGVFLSPTNDLCFQLVLMCCAELIFFGQRKMKPGFFDKGAPASMRGEAARRTVVFDGVEAGVINAMTLDDLKREFAQVFGPVQRIAFDLPRTLRVTFAEPTLDPSSDSSLHGTDTTHLAGFSLTQVFGPTSAIQTLLRICRQHPAKRELLPFRQGDIAARFPAPFDDVSPDSFEFPKPSVACSQSAMKGVLVSDAMLVPANADRWSVLFGACDAAQPDGDRTTLTQLGCGFAVMRQGSGQGSGVVTSMVMLLCTIRTFPLAAVIASHRDKLGRIQLGIVAATPEAATGSQLQFDTSLMVTSIRIGAGTVEDLPGAPLREVVHLANIVLLLIELVQRGDQRCSAPHLAYLHSQLNAMFSQPPLGLSKASRKTPTWVCLVPLVMPFQGKEVVLLHAEAMAAALLGSDVYSEFNLFIQNSASRAGRTDGYDDDDPDDDPAFLLEEACKLFVENKADAFEALVACRLGLNRGGGLDHHAAPPQSEDHRWLEQIRHSKPPFRSEHTKHHQSMKEIQKSHPRRSDAAKEQSRRQEIPPPSASTNSSSSKLPVQSMRKDPVAQRRVAQAATSSPTPIDANAWPHPAHIEDDDLQPQDDLAAPVESEFIRQKKSNGTWKCTLCHVGFAPKKGPEGSVRHQIDQHQQEKRHLKLAVSATQNVTSQLHDVEQKVLAGTCFTIKNELMWCTVCGCAVSGRKKTIFNASKAKTCIQQHILTEAHQRIAHGSNDVQAVLQTSPSIDPLGPRAPVPHSQNRTPSSKTSGVPVAASQVSVIDTPAEDDNKSDSDDDDDDVDVSALVASAESKDNVFLKKRNGQIRCKGCKTIVVPSCASPAVRAELLNQHRLDPSHIKRASSYITNRVKKVSARDAAKKLVIDFLQGTSYAVRGSAIWCTTCGMEIVPAKKQQKRAANNIDKARVIVNDHNQDDLHRTLLQLAAVSVGNVEVPSGQ